VDVEGWREIECTRWSIGRCVVILCVQVGWFVGGRNECKFCGGLCGSCLIRVTSMHYIKSIRMFDLLGGLSWWSNVCNLPNVCLLWGVSISIRVLPSAFLFCVLTVNVIGLIFLQQCFVGLLSSTETSISGTSRKLPL
jgi:hypothetical protein